MTTMLLKYCKGGCGTRIPPYTSNWICTRCVTKDIVKQYLDNKFSNKEQNDMKTLLLTQLTGDKVCIPVKNFKHATVLDNNTIIFYKFFKGNTRNYKVKETVEEINTIIYNLSKKK